MGARLNGIQEATGSIPVGSTPPTAVFVAREHGPAVSARAPHRETTPLDDAGNAAGLGKGHR